MDEQFKIFKLTAEGAGEIAAAPNTPHIHDYEELLVGIEGVLEHFIDFQSTRFSAPFVCFITKGKLHRVKPILLNGKCNIWVMRFSSDFVPGITFRLYAYYHEHANLELENDDCFNRIVSLCEMINAEMQSPSPGLAVVRDLLKAIFTMLEAEKEKLALADQSFPHTHNTTFLSFLRILEENFRRPEGVEFYAGKLFMSSRNLNLICQSILNKSVSEIIETRKLVEAKTLLIYSDKSISEIGFELGYNENAYFTSVFKKKIGETPTGFRLKMNKLIS
jgi:AraC-like DNA-binding protein